MERHTRYLELRLAQCTSRPELHRHQIPVLRELIDLSRSGVSPREYNRRAQHLFGLIRAEWLDRYDNLAGMYAALGDDRLQHAAEVSRSAGDATNFTELSTYMSRVMTRAGRIQLATATAVDSLAPLVVTLLHWATDGDARKRDALAETIKGLWRAIQHNDPGCSWQRICSHPPYRDRLPFHQQGLALIGSWLDRAVGTQLADVPDREIYDPPALPVIETPDDPQLPSVADAARGYHIAYDLAKQSDQRAALPIYERIFEIEAVAECANDFLCKLVAENLLCELSRAHHYEIANDALAHCARLSQPHVEHHYTSLVAALKRCASATEIDHEIARHEACFAVESAWNHIFIHYAFRTIIAAMGYELNPSETQRDTVRNSYAVSSQLFGDWQTMFAIPRVWSFYCSVFFRLGQELVDPPPIDGIMRGEVGLDLLGAFRDHALGHVIDFVSAREFATTEELDAEVERLVNSRRFATAQDMRAHVSALFQAAMAGQEPPPNHVATNHSTRGVILWGQDVLFEALQAALSSPTRPC